MLNILSQHSFSTDKRFVSLQHLGIMLKLCYVLLIVLYFLLFVQTIALIVLEHLSFGFLYPVRVISLKGTKICNNCTIYIHIYLIIDKSEITTT